MNKRLKNGWYAVCGFFLCCFLSCAQKPEPVQFAYNPAQMDTGYLYEYRGSYNRQQFSAGSDVQYFYLTAPDTLETITILDDCSDIKGLLTYSREIMDWRFCMFKEIVSESFLTKHFSLTKNAGTSVKETVRKNYETGEAYYDSYTMLGFKPETLKKPEHSTSTERIDLDKLKEQTIFQFNMNIPGEFFMLSRFFTPDTRKSIVPVSQAGYETKAVCMYEKKETVSYAGTEWNCLKFRMEPVGLMARIFGKKLYFWLEADSGFYYLVRFRNENWPFNEYRLARRTAMKPDEWESFKQTIKDEFSPEGYAEIDYEE